MAVISGFLQSIMLALLALVVAVSLGFTPPTVGQHNVEHVLPPASVGAGATYATL